MSKKMRTDRSQEEIKRMAALYEEGKSLSEVGENFGISTSRVEQIFRRHNIKTRKKTISKKFHEAMDERRVFLPEDQLVKLYSAEKLSIQKIADKLETGYHIVRRNLQYYRIPIRPLKNYNQSHLTPELLRRLYIDQNLPAKEIAERLGYAASTIGKKLSIFGINRSAASIKSSKINQPIKKTVNEADLISSDTLTVEQIVHKYKIHPVTVRNLIRKGIFPNAFRQKKGKSTIWVIPAADLKNFSPRRKGGERINAPTVAAIRSRGKYARNKIKKSHGYGKEEIREMINLENQNLTRPEIAVRFRIDETLVADILNEAAARKPGRKKPVSVKKELKRLDERSLRDLYEKKKLSTAYILKELDTNYASLYISLRHYGIPLRDERLRFAAQEKEQILYQLYVEEGLSPEAIAEQLDLTIDYARRKINELRRRLKKQNSSSPR